MFHNRTLLWYPESNKKNQPRSNMTKLSMLVVLGLAFITMTSAAPYYQRYNNNPFQHFLRYGQMNDNENENYERENKFADNVQNEDDSSSEEDSSESNESSFTSELSSLSSVVGPSSLVAESSMTDPPVEIATATIPLATTTIAMPVETTTTVRETTTVRDTSTPRQVDRGDAGSGPAPGVNSPQVNVVTTGAMVTNAKRATEKTKTTQKITPEPAKPTCRTSCPLENDAVCGSDGETYVSQCVFEAVMCRNNTPEFFVEHKGECKTEQLAPDTAKEPGNLDPVGDQMP